MPQMKPLSWMFLLYFFALALLLTMNSLYFKKLMMPMEHKTNIKPKKNNWKW